jgi:hypothetical protein
VVLGANTLAFAMLWIVKFMVFNRLFHVDPVSEAEAELFKETVAEIERAEP